jgi:hypothetical protein
MNRRDFLLGNPEKGTIMISCETIFMRYADSQLDGTEGKFLRQVRETFGLARRIRLYDAFWLDQEGLREKVRPLVEEFVCRGGTVEYF